MEYRVCARCVMDSSDPEIEFDSEGICNHCKDHIQNLSRLHIGPDGLHKLEQIVSDIKRRGEGKRYDCVIGVSGGVDSTYTLWKAKELGLRPLALHLDNGWNSEIAVSNIAAAVHNLGIDLHTYVIDWEEFRDLQRAFLLASVPDVEVMTDHAILASLQRTSAKLGVPSIAGTNHRTESHLPRSWSQGHVDYGYIRAIHRQYSSGRIKTFPHLNFYYYLTYLSSGSPAIAILDYLDYSKTAATELVERELGWRDYGGKHHENLFTRWYQGCYLPRKFGFDKRRSHLSSLVSSGQLSRDEALAQLQPPPYPVELQEQDCDYVAKKLKFSRAELDRIMAAPPRKFDEFPSYWKILHGRTFTFVRKINRLLRLRAAPKPALQ